MRKAYLVIPALLTVPFVFNNSARAATYYVDCSVASSGNGTSWGTAWKALSNISGLSAGDIVYISGSSKCATYSTTQWTPINGSVGNPIIYRVGQDAEHNSPVTVSLGMGPGMAGTNGQLTGIYIDGNYQGKRNMTIRGLLGSAGTPTAWIGVRLSYLTMDRTQVEGGAFTNFQLDNNYIDLPPNSDHFFSRNSNARGSTGYTVNLIHDNIIRTRQSTNGSGYGDDGFQWLNSASVYNNVFYTVFDSSQTIQHQDFIQTCDSYLAVYDNYFENPGNYAVYGDCFGSSAHWRIYNNVFAEFSGHGTGISAYMVGIGFEPQAGTGLSLDDFIVSNNTCYYGDSGHNCVGINPGNTGNTGTNSYVVNNLCYNSGVDIVPGSSGSIGQANNFQGTTNIKFVAVGPYPTGNWDETSSSTNSIGKGISPSYLTSVYSTDYAGNARGSTWDIGAYEYNSVTAAAPQSPSGLSAMVN